jgi:hypothetical protein
MQSCEKRPDTVSTLEKLKCDDFLVSQDLLLQIHDLYRYAGGTIIDYGLLEAIPNQLIITPQINYQTGFADFNDATDVPTQLKAGAAFQKACMPSIQKTAA